MLSGKVICAYHKYLGVAASDHEGLELYSTARPTLSMEL